MQYWFVSMPHNYSGKIEKIEFLPHHYGKLGV
jgi:hypothetical protein